MDSQGIPICVEPFSSFPKLQSSRIIFAGNKKAWSDSNLLQILDGGDGYILSRSLSISTEEEQQWAKREEGYIPAGGGWEYKSRIVQREAKDKKGNARIIKEQAVVCRKRKVFQLVTSEPAMDPREVLNRYREILKVRKHLREMMTDRADCIGTVGLVIMEIIEKKTGEMDWDDCRDALLKWQVSRLPGDLYRFAYVDDPDVKRILDAFGISIPARLYREEELEQLRKEISVF